MEWREEDVASALLCSSHVPRVDAPISVSGWPDALTKYSEVDTFVYLVSSS